MTQDTYDVAIIGAGAAGLTAAAVLARAHRKVLLIDNGKQSNLASDEAHAVFTRDKTAPSDLYKIANHQLAEYETVTIINKTIMTIKRISSGFELTDNLSRTFNSRIILLSQGMQYTPVNIPGVSDLFGHSAWHCPYCDGYEAEGKKVLAIYDIAAQQHMKKILPIWIENLHFKHPNEILSVKESPSGISVKLTTGETEEFDQLAVQTTLTQRDNLYEQLGCTLTDTGRVQIDQTNATSTMGVFAAGDQSSEKSQVNLAVASGHLAGININGFLSG